MTVGIVFAAAITPGPNNFFVLSAAMDGGMRAATATGAGVLSGSAALLAVAWLGAEATFTRLPWLQSVVVVVGAIYLAWLGLSLVVPAGRNDAPRPAARTLSWRRVAMFQLVNPKAWLLVTTVTVLVTDAIAAPWSLMLLAVVVLGVSAVCLTAWALAGLSLSRLVRSPRLARGLDVAMGVMLLAVAGWIVIDHAA